MFMLIVQPSTHLTGRHLLTKPSTPDVRQETHTPFSVARTKKPYVLQYHEDMVADASIGKVLMIIASDPDTRK